MKQLVRLAVVAALAVPALAADTKITTAVHTDASMMMGQATPAKDATRTTWIGKDKLRIEEGDKLTIVRTDLKKMFFVNVQDKTYSAVDLPFDMKKHAPEAAPFMEGMAGTAKVTVTPTTETKKIKEWNATKHTLSMSMQMGPMPITVTQDMWLTKDAGIEGAAFADLYGSMLSMAPGGSLITAEIKKLEGFPVLTEKTVNVMGGDTKSRDEVTAIEVKDAAADAYDVPKDFTEKPFDFMTDNPNGGMGPGGGARGPGGPRRAPGGKPPGEKPVEPPKVPLTPPK